MVSYREEEKKERERQRARRLAEAERMAAGGWGDWSECTQIRRSGPGLLEFRNSTPAAMLVGLGLVVAAAEMAFWGLFLPYRGAAAGILAAAAGVAVFLIGRGTAIDGTRRKVRRWWGWVPKPLFSSEQSASVFDRLEISKKLGMRPWEAGVGRTVRYPLQLVKPDGRRLLLKLCPSLGEARELAEEISRLSGLPARDASGEPTGRKRQSAEKPPEPAVPSTAEETWVREHIVELAESQFPDNRGLDWIIHGLSHRGDLILVEVEPVPDEVGYPRFQLAVAGGRDGEAEVVGVYCLEGGELTLLSSSRGWRKKLPRRLQ